MADSSDIDRSTHYRHKSEELRTIAETMTHPNTRLILLRLATSYDLMAHQLENGPTELSKTGLG